MTYLQAIILAMVEGITEFLPISSTGHLLLTSKILQISQTEFVKSFEIIIQLGAILAIILLYAKKLIRKRKVGEKIIVAFIPAMVIGFILYKFIKHFLLGNSFVTLAALFLGGVALILLELGYKEQNHYLNNIEKVSFAQALMIGLFQTLALIPGVSRAGATIFAGMALGLKRKTAVEFSFLLAIPTMAAATGLDLVTSSLTFTPTEILTLLIGLAGAFITALVSVRFLLRYVTRHTFIPFGAYRIILSLIFWLMPGN
ncbi:undecaprenyl-diphosphate phosphatase [Candidatus Woesebacteria bacterium]|nr:undecaprenyl-diphosphate phosphatase [Candidatus Woesebacteria bacterium]